MSHFQLLGKVHAGPGGLLAVPQRGIEDDQAVVLGHGQAPLETVVITLRVMLLSAYHHAERDDYGKIKSPGTSKSQGRVPQCGILSSTAYLGPTPLKGDQKAQKQ